MEKRCPVVGCDGVCKTHCLTCSKCWYRVPQALRDAVWREYRKRPSSPAHLLACAAAVSAARKAFVVAALEATNEAINKRRGE